MKSIGHKINVGLIMIIKRKKQRCDSQAVSELIGTVLLLAIAVALFSVVYVIVSTVLVGEAVPQVNIVGYVEGDNIILENLGGNSLGSGTLVQYTIAGNKTTVPLNTTTLIDENNNNRWDIGERIVYDGGSLTGNQVDAAVIYSPSNSAIFYSNLQTGSSNGTIIIDVNTSVNTIEPYSVTASPHTLVATGESRLTSVTLWYRYSSDNTTWNSSSSWWNQNWTYARPITIDHTLIDTSLTDFPILLRIESSIASKCDNGRSIRFINPDNETDYKYEIERWPSSGTCEVWVKIPYISASVDTSFYLYYNNSAATDDQNPEDVWDANYVMVQRLNESSGTLYDSTPYQNDAFEHGTTTLNATGIIDGAVEFEGSTQDYLEIDDATSLDITSEITMSLWVTADSFSNYPDLLVKGDYDAYSCWIRPDGKIWFSLNDEDVLSSTSALSTGNWYYISCTLASDNTRRVYINGAQNAQDTFSASINTNNGDLYVSTNDWSLNGIIDEVRLSYTARNASWIKASYYNQKNSQSLLSIGAEETHHTGVNWTNFATTTTYPWEWDFTFPNSTGYYQFYSIGRYNAQTEDAPSQADAMCRYVGSEYTWTQSSQEDFEAGTAVNIDTTSSPGNVILAQSREFIYAFRGDDNDNFWRYNISDDSWSSLEDAPSNIDLGGALTNDGTYIYGFRGNDEKDFWRYSITADSWTDLADALERIKEGGSLTYVNNYIYALRGNDKKNFNRYDISGDSWTSLADAPEKVKWGGALTNDNDNFIYAFQGNDADEFWRYNISSNTWTSLADTPENVLEGGGLTYYNDYVYGFRGDDENDFWRYDISTNTWASMANAPNDVKEGGALTTDGTYIYAFRGDDRDDFWRYNISANSWSSLEDTPSDVKSGGALTCVDSDDYLSSGSLTASPHDCTFTALITEVSWDATLNSQMITMQIRSDDNAAMTSPSSWETVTNGDTTISTPANRYIQYKATLSTDTSSVTPILHVITITYRRE